MTTATGMTAVGTIVETIGAETTGAGISGAEISGVESKPAEKPSAIVIGSATITRTIAVTIVASAKPRNNPGRQQPLVTGRNRPGAVIQTPRLKTLFQATVCNLTFTNPCE